MEMLLYNRLNTAPVQRQFDKTISYLQQGDFRSADVRKMKSNGFYRARLDDTNRLLFKIGDYDGKKYLFILEVILNHDYDKSRFLRGAAVKEEKLTPIYGINAVPDDDIMCIAYLNPRSRHFTILDKCVTLSEEQSEILYHEPPMLLLGAAGSGKTVLALEKIRNTKGRILYVTLSQGLAQKASEVYHKDQAPFAEQEVLFCSLDQYLRQFGDVPNREASFEDFKQWFERIRPTVRIKDCHKIFEEIRGVLTGTASERGFFSLEEYQQLGVRQSVFANGDREEVHSVFSRYLAWLKTENLYDPNIFAFAAQKYIKPTYDMVVVDEVQDFTTMQLSAVLKSLKHTTQFLLCGDANQVVHPNFFSWTSVKRLLHQRDLSRDIIRLLPGNHRNDDNIIKLANKVLALKNARFGSIDRESSNIIDANELSESEENTVRFFEDSENILAELNQIYAVSSYVAIIVLREEDKADAQKKFKTPMIFTVQEAKGLEFDYVILYNFITNSAEQFASICEGVAPRDINGQLQYMRPKDKEDRSLQAFQFYINSLYVAMTRAIRYLYIVEHEKRHRLLSLLGVRNLHKRLGKRYPVPNATLADWQRAADNLEKLGRKEQSEGIKAKIGKTVPVPWDVYTYQDYVNTREHYFFLLEKAKKSRPSFNTRELTKMYNFLLFYPEKFGVVLLFNQSLTWARRYYEESKTALQKMLMPYQADNIKRIEPLIQKYGPDFRNEIALTPLMLASMAGAINIVKYLLMAGADPSLSDNWGRTAFQLAIVRAFKDEKYAKEKFIQIANLVQPLYFDIKDGENKLAIPQGTKQNLITNIILALQLEFFYMRGNEKHVGFTVDDICKILQYFVTDEKSAQRFKRETVLAHLNKSDVILNQSPYIIRLNKNYYTLMFRLEVKIFDEWVMLQDLLDIFRLQMVALDPGIKNFCDDVIAWAERYKEAMENRLVQKMQLEDDAVAAALPDDSLRDWPA